MAEHYQVVELGASITLDQLKQMCPDFDANIGEGSYEVTVTDHSEGQTINAAANQNIGISQGIAQFSASQEHCNTVVGQYEDQSYVIPVTVREDAADHNE